MTSSDEPRTIRIVAALIADGDGRTLLVRKRGTAKFMLPGGKPDPGETDLAALAREIEEELGCALDRDSCVDLGEFASPAAHEPGFTVSARLFATALRERVRARGEIEELAWVDPDEDPGLDLAPLARAHALPIARELKRERR